MKIIGLLGGVASGKSLVAAQLRALGAGVLDADRAGHEVLREPAVVAAVRARWGDEIFDIHGHVNRLALGAIVFGDGPKARASLAYLEQLTHPRINQRLRDEIESLRAAGCPAAVLDAPVMLKAGWDKFCDALWFVDAPPAVRLARAMERGWTAEHFAAREAAQEPVEEKRRLAAAVIDNGGSADHTCQQVARLWQELLGNG